ncbi:hypothetical protein MMC16_002875 [Acarospora aff. strigata]|nr:hypothetical protein [Acarospora aff. strigata]
MSAPGSITRFLGYVAFELSLIQPLIPTYIHLLAAALFPIYTGSHASLSRPSSAAKPPKHKKGSTDTDEDEVAEETSQKMEGLSPADAIMFPLLAGTTLAGLYFFLKWLRDPTLLNKVLNWYFSGFGVLSVSRLLADSMGVVTSFLLPSRYVDEGVEWRVDAKHMATESVENDGETELNLRHSPLPGIAGRVSLPTSISNFFWTLRRLPSRKLRVQAYVRSMIEADLRIGIQGLTALGLSIAAVAYFNLLAKPWWLTNLLGFGFAYSALQFMSPTTFWTGTLILSSLFVYDIYFVFFTPLMVTVATKLDIPIKLLFPRPPGPDADPAKQSLSMLGLGDVVLPGMMIGLALRFDLYLFYLRKQSHQATVDAHTADIGAQENKPGAPDDSKQTVSKAKWHSATGCWGERFWIGQSHVYAGSQHMEGRIFPKTYFHASLRGYVVGMLVTLGVMQIAGHAQPALLYLVPGVLGSLWGTALLRGDLKEMWEYTEASEEEDEAAQGKEQSKTIESIFSLKRAEKTTKKLERALIEGDTSEHEKPGEQGTRDKSTNVLVAVIEARPQAEIPRRANGPTANNLKLPFTPDKDAKMRRNKHDIVFFSISLPAPPNATKHLAETAVMGDRHLSSLEDELKIASEGNLGPGSANTSSFTSRASSPRRRTTAPEQEPDEKRRRVE